MMIRDYSWRILKLYYIDIDLGNYLFEGCSEEIVIE
jgi:hypothetical protein